MKPPKHVHIDDDNGICWSLEDGENPDGFNIHCGRVYVGTVRPGNARRFQLHAGCDGAYSISAWTKDDAGISAHSRKSEVARKLIPEITIVQCHNQPEIEQQFHGTEPEEVRESYELVFEDQFNLPPGTTSPDPAKWDTSLLWGPDTIINNEEQRYIDVKNGDVSGASPFDFHPDGHLIIRATPTTPAEKAATGANYFSGAIAGHSTNFRRYGYLETRLKLPETGEGIWPAFWLLHRFYNYPQDTGANGKRRTEIDWEFPRGPGSALWGGGPYTTERAFAAYHYDDGLWKIDANGFNGRDANGAYTLPALSQQCDGTPIHSASGFPGVTLPGGADHAADWHTYGIWWEEGFVKWYLDGVEVRSFCDPLIASQIVMYPILNLAAGGNFPGPADPATFPAEMMVDWFCWFQRRPDVVGTA